MFRCTTALPLAVAVVALAACGDDGTTASGDGANADRIVEIEMVDIAFGAFAGLA